MGRGQKRIQTFWTKIQHGLQLITPSLFWGMISHLTRTQMVLSATNIRKSKSKDLRSVGEIFPRPSPWWNIFESVYQRSFLQILCATLHKVWKLTHVTPRQVFEKVLFFAHGKKCWKFTTWTAQRFINGGVFVLLDSWSFWVFQPTVKGFPCTPCQEDSEESQAQQFQRHCSNRKIM